MIAQPTNTMWVYRGYGHWAEFPCDAPEAITYRQAVAGMTEAVRKRREHAFAFWMEKRQRFIAERDQLKFRMVNFDEPVVDLIKELAPEHRTWVLDAEGRDEDIHPQFVALKHIIPTQEEVNQELVNLYGRFGCTYDHEGKLPLAIRFYGDEQVYLINGHHRYASNIAYARGTHHMMYLDVDHVDMSFEEACGTLAPFPVDVVNLFEILLGAVA